MTETVQIGLWILLAMVLVVFVVSGYVYARNRRDEESTDLEHFDHEPSQSLE